MTDEDEDLGVAIDGDEQVEVFLGGVIVVLFVVAGFSAGFAWALTLLRW